MAEEFIPVLEKDLGALAPDRTVAKVRAVDDQGHSVSLTPAQTSALVLTDANKPRIQELSGFSWPKASQGLKPIPNEFWPDRNGRMRQVYAVTLIGTTGKTSGGFNVSKLGLFQVEAIDFSISCSVEVGGRPVLFDYHLAGPDLNLTTYPESGVLGAACSNPVHWGRPYCFIAKCTLYNE